ncbi:MAG: hypothetical protein JSS38_18395 [Nitrospira sp.]|nr:hypothetical protein [Nitrospira sp.]
MFGKPLTAAFAGLWRYRIGDYRAICRIEAHRLVVLCSARWAPELGVPGVNL